MVINIDNNPNSSINSQYRKTAQSLAKSSIHSIPSTSMQTKTCSRLKGEVGSVDLEASLAKNKIRHASVSTNITDYHKQKVIMKTKDLNEYELDMEMKIH